jgi:hypothetical protein
MDILQRQMACRSEVAAIRFSTIGNGLQVVQSIARPWTGLAVLAATTFSAGEIITVYDGKLHSRSELPDARDPISILLTHVCALPTTGLIIAGLIKPRRGCGAGSFVNHSAPPGANSKMKLMKFSHKYYCGKKMNRVVAFVATRRIKAGQEIFCR